MTLSRSCSFCDTLNDARVRFCSECGHQPHAPRTECRCPVCERPERTPEQKELDLAFFREAALFLYATELDAEAAARFRKMFPAFDWEGDRGFIDEPDEERAMENNLMQESLFRDLIGSRFEFCATDDPRSGVIFTVVGVDSANPDGGCLLTHLRSAAGEECLGPEPVTLLFELRQSMKPCGAWKYRLHGADRA